MNKIKKLLVVFFTVCFTSQIFAEAFGRDPEFFAFYRAMQAYETALIGGDTSVILSPDSEFFKFFGNIKPKK